MQIRLIFFSVILIYTSHIKSQENFIIRGRTLDYKTGKVLPYVNIMLLNKSVGTTSDENGVFFLKDKDLKPTDTLFFSHVSYFSKKISLDHKPDSIIRLRPKSITLNDINLGIEKNKYKNKNIVLNKFKPKKTALSYHNNPSEDRGNIWIPYREMEPKVETMFFPYHKKYGDFPQLNEVTINFKSFKKKSKFRLRIFQPNQNGLPSEEVQLKNSIIEVIEDEPIVKIDLEGDNIFISKQGLFVGVEYLLISDNLTIEKHKNNKSKTYLYSPFLKYIRVKDFYEYYIFTKGKWQKIRKIAPNYFDAKDKKKYSYKPAISIKINY